MSRNFWQGEKVRLRAIEPKDADFFFTFNLDGEIERRIDEIHFPQSYERVKSWAEKKATEDPQNDGFFWVAENREGEPVGSISTHECNRQSGNFCYGIAVDRPHWGKGYATEMVRLVVAYFFFELNYQKVTVNIYGFNDRSIRLHERLGFQKEGELRNMYYTGGRHYNELFYGMTRQEYIDRYGVKGIGD